MDRGGQPGNKNATKNKPITEELTKVLHEQCEHNGEKTIKLRKLVSVWVDSALDGDRNATKEIVDRIEGKASQAIEHSGQLDTAPLREDAMATLLARIDAISGRLPDKDPTGSK